MGQAKLRGTLDERIQQGIIKKENERKEKLAKLALEKQQQLEYERSLPKVEQVQRKRQRTKLNSIAAIAAIGLAGLCTK